MSGGSLTLTSTSHHISAQFNLIIAMALMVVVRFKIAAGVWISVWTNAVYSNNQFIYL